MALSLLDSITAEFSGFDVLLYWWYTVKTFLSQYSWQVRTAYSIIFICIVALLVLMLLFWRQIKDRDEYNKHYQTCSNSYYDVFQEILQSAWEYDAQEVLDACDATEDDFDHYDGLLFADLICRIRMELREIAYLPNLQILAEVTGAKRAIELNLSKGKNVNKCLQLVCTMPLVINEGLLSLYTSNKDGRAMQLARLANMIVNTAEPFSCLLTDMNEAQAPIYRINIHRIFAWRNAQDMMVAPILMLAQTCKNTEMASFLISEVAYWGTPEEKSHLVDFLSDERIPCRMAAIEAMSQLLIPETEDLLYNSYDVQPQEVRRAILKALVHFHTGKYTEFFANIFNTAPSHISRINALECIYTYTPESKEYFEEMYKNCREKDKLMFDQVRTSHTVIIQKYLNI